MATSKIDNHSKIVQEILLESQQLPKATSKPYLPSATSTFSVNKTGWSVKELTPNDVKTEEKNRMDNKGWVIKQVGSDFDSINCNSTNIFTSISAWKAQENNVYDVKVGLWDSVTAGSGIFRDRVLQECRESSKRKRPNKEDLEYDRGRLKKVRKNKASNWTVRLLNSR